MAEAAAIGLPHDSEGQAIHTFVLCAQALPAHRNWQKNYDSMYRTHLGPSRNPEDVTFVDKLPKRDPVRSCAAY